MSLIDSMINKDYVDPGIAEGKYDIIPKGYEDVDKFGYEQEPIARATGMGDYDRWESGSDVLGGLGNIVSGTLKGFGYDLEDPEDLATTLALGLILPGPLKKVAKNLKKGAKATSKAAKKVKEGYGKTIGKGTPVNTAIRKTLNQFFNPLWASKHGAGTYFGKGRLGRAATAPNIYMGSQLFKEPFSERDIGGPFSDILNLLQESRADYFTKGKAGELGVKATQKILDFGGDKESIKKRKEKIRDLVDEQLGIESGKDTEKKSPSEKGFKINWEGF